MIDNAVLVVDADKETEEKVVSALETEGYTVYAYSGNDISAGMAEKIDPFLIYLKATSSTFEVCRRIRKIEKFKKVPIILLGSLSETLDAQAYFDGIVDYIKMPVSLDDLVEKTGVILGRAPDLTGKQEDIVFMKDETLPAEEPSKVEDAYSVDAKTDYVSEISQPGEEYSDTDEKDEIIDSPPEESIGERSHISGILTPFNVVIAALVILAAGFFLYKFSISKPEIPVSVAVDPQNTFEYQEPELLPLQDEQKQEEPAIEEEPAVKNEAPEETLDADEPPIEVDEQPFYSAQLGAFKMKANAEALAKTYKEKGYETFVYKRTSKRNKVLYLVLIGKFEKRKEASRLAGDIRKKEKIETTVFSGNAKNEMFLKNVPELSYVL